MVNRVDGNKYYEYTKLKNVNVSDTGEKFSLDYKQDELQPEAKEKKDKDKMLSAQEKQQIMQQSGVKLELSGQGQTASADMDRLRNRNAADAAAQPSLFELVQSFFTTLISTIKDFFYKIWYDPEPPADSSSLADNGSETASEKELVETENISAMNDQISERNEASSKQDVTDMDALTAHRVNEERLQREIQPYLRSGDLNQVISLLTDNGRKTTARNSTLLTYYDRNGRMVEPSASDRERILHGDRNTRKL